MPHALGPHHLSTSCATKDLLTMKHCLVTRWSSSPCKKIHQTSVDCRMDAPLAPKLCAGVLGRALLQGVLPPDAIPELCKPIEGGEVRRALIAPALQYVKVGDTRRLFPTPQMRSA